MRIFLTYIIKSMLEKKSRLILILTAIALSSGLLIGSLGMVDAGTQTLVKSQREALEHKDIKIYSKKGDGSFRIKRMKEAGVTNLVPQIIYPVTYGNQDEIHISLYGREKEYIDQGLFIDQDSYNKLENKKCIISIRAAQDQHLEVGDKLEVKINDAKVTLEIVGLANCEGIFYGDTKENFTMLIDYHFLADRLGMNGRYNCVMANKTESTVRASIEAFKAANPKLEAAELFSDYNDYSQQMSMPLYFMLVIIICMSIMIIFSSFKLMITERLTVIGTFLSQGATKGTIKGILYIESLLYGSIGGILGNLLGIGITAITTYLMSPLKDYGIIEKVVVNEAYLLIGFLFAVGLSFISAIIPIKQINRLHVKALILKQTKEEKNVSWKKVLMGCILLIGAYIINELKGEDYYSLSPISYLASIIGVIMVFPIVLTFLSNLLFRLTKKRWPVMGIALNNVGTSKVLIDNIKLMFIAMLVVITIQSASEGVMSHVSEAYEKLTYDIDIELPSDEKKAESIMRTLKRDKGVIASTCQQSYTQAAEISGESVYAIGIDADRYVNYNQYLDWTTYKQAYDTFKSGNHHMALISTQVAKMTGLKEGDYFELEINEDKAGFEVAGIIDGKLYMNNIFVIIKNEAFESYYHRPTPDYIFCSTQESSSVVMTRIQREVNEKGGSIRSFDDEREDNMRQNAQLFLILNIISVMAIIISALGILNNISIGFIQRKKSMVVLCSVGMGVSQRTGMLLYEALLTSLWPALIIYCFAPMNMETASKLMSLLMKMEIPMPFNRAIMPQMILIAIIMMLIASLPIIRQNHKFQIVEELKYE